MNGQYEFKTSVTQLVAMFDASLRLAMELPDGGLFERSALALLHTMCACVIDKSTGEYVNIQSFGLTLIEEGPDALADWLEAFKEYCNELFEADEENDRLAPFKKFLEALDDC